MPKTITVKERDGTMRQLVVPDDATPDEIDALSRRPDHPHATFARQAGQLALGVGEVLNPLNLVDLAKNLVTHPITNVVQPAVEDLFGVLPVAERMIGGEPARGIGNILGALALPQVPGAIRGTARAAAGASRTAEALGRAGVELIPFKTKLERALQVYRETKAGGALPEAAPSPPALLQNLPGEPLVRPSGVPGRVLPGPEPQFLEPQAPLSPVLQRPTLLQDQPSIRSADLVEKRPVATPVVPPAPAPPPVSKPAPSVQKPLDLLPEDYASGTRDLRATAFAKALHLAKVGVEDLTRMGADDWKIASDLVRSMDVEDLVAGGLPRDIAVRRVKPVNPPSKVTIALIRHELERLQSMLPRSL